MHTFDAVAHTRRLLAGLLSMPGYIDDVAQRMIVLAALMGEGKTIECHYGGIPLHARRDSTVAQIRSYYERACRERNRPVRRLHLVAC